MKLKNRLLIFIMFMLLSIIFIIVKNKSENSFKKVNMLSGNICQTKDYKLYEFGIRDNEICKQMDDIVDEVVNNYIEYIDFEYVDVTENMSLSNIYNIQSIPTFIIVDLQGNVKYRITGRMSKKELIEFINKINK